MVNTKPSFHQSCSFHHLQQPAQDQCKSTKWVVPSHVQPAVAHRLGDQRSKGHPQLQKTHCHHCHCRHLPPFKDTTTEWILLSCLLTLSTSLIWKEIDVLLLYFCWKEMSGVILLSPSCPLFDTLENISNNKWSSLKCQCAAWHVINFPWNDIRILPAWPFF